MDILNAVTSPTNPQSFFALALRPQTRPRCSLNSYGKGEVTENSPLLATHWCSTVPNHKTSCAQRSGQDCDWLKIKLFIFALSGLRLSRLTTHDSRLTTHANPTTPRILVVGSVRRYFRTPA
jgi:hypothetical protein